MEFEWDKEKARVNLKKHAIRFDEAKLIFDAPVLTRTDDRRDYGEVREIRIGMLSPEAALLVAHAARGQKTRLISARKASRRERTIYYDYLEKTLEGN